LGFQYETIALHVNSQSTSMPVPLPPSPQLPQVQAPVEQQRGPTDVQAAGQQRDKQTITPEQFQAWQQQRGMPTAQALAAAAARRTAAIQAGSIPLEELTGRELHEHHPELFDGH
jgi:hypothetical protein